jgi:hypothetical protein
MINDYTNQPGIKTLYGLKKNENIVRTVLLSNRQIIETEAKSIPLIHKYMTGHSPGFVLTNK